MGLGGLLGGLLGAAGSYMGSKQQSKAMLKMQKEQYKQLNSAAKGLEEGFQSVIDDIMANPAGYAGTRVKAALYQNVSLDDSLRASIAANLNNFKGASGLASRVNEHTLANDMARFRAFFPKGFDTMGALSNQANSLSMGQLPQDVINSILSNSAGRGAGFGVPGGNSPASLKDLGLASLDAVDRGASLFQQIIGAAESISPISRQMTAANYQFDPRTALQADMSQALLQQQSQQNYNNLAATPDPALAMQAQLRLQMTSNSASTKAGTAAMQQQPVMPYAQIYGQAGNALGQGLGALFSGFGGGGNEGGGGGSWFGGGGSNNTSFNPSAYNSYAQNYNSNLSSGAAPKAYVVNY